MTETASDRLAAFKFGGGDTSKVASQRQLARLYLTLAVYYAVKLDPVDLVVWGLLDAKERLIGIVISPGGGALVGVPWAALKGTAMQARLNVSVVRGSLRTRMAIETVRKPLASKFSLAVKVHPQGTEQPVAELDVADLDPRTLKASVSLRYPARFDLREGARDMETVHTKSPGALLVGAVKVKPIAKGVAVFSAEGYRRQRGTMTGSDSAG